jgi:uncharacterized membrane protein YkvA (DUF1232 family)
MTYSQLLRIIEQTKLSPESLAPKLGVSNMTIRRWKDQKPNKIVPVAYERLLVEAVHQMIIDGDIEATDPAVAELLRSSSPTSVNSAMHSLGIDQIDLKSGTDQADSLIRILHKIGFSDHHREDVDKAKERLWGFRKMGAEWRRVLSVLIQVIKSKRLGHIDKLVAYGALFYLLCPFDLIPDHIPVLGYTDDFAILTVAAGYYLSKGFRARDNEDVEKDPV